MYFNTMDVPLRQIMYTDITIKLPTANLLALIYITKSVTHWSTNETK